MLRTILTTGAAMLLSLAFLAACETDTTDDAGSGDESEDVEETTAPDDEDTDETATEDDDADSATPEDSDESDADETATSEEGSDETATSDEDSDAADDGDESASGETIEVTLSDYDIEVESPLPSGEVVLEVTNESDGLHALAIERTSGPDADGSEESEGADDSEESEATEESDDGEGTEDSDDAENGDDEDSAEVIEAINVEGGETRELELELEPGEYTFFGALGELRENEGMETDVTVE